MIDNEFGNDILTLEDDDGVEHTFEVLDAIDNGENRYMALSPVYDDPQQTLEDSGELVILKVITVDGEVDEVDFYESFKMFMTETTDRICFSYLSCSCQHQSFLIRFEEIS